MGVLDFIFSLIVFMTVGAVGLTVVAGRMAWKGGKRLLSWMSEQRKLPGQTQSASREAQDVVVEAVDDAPAQRPSAPPHRAYERLDVDNGSTAADIARVMSAYVGDAVVGTYAQAVIDTLESAELRRQSLFAELDGTFQRGSLSWDKFAGPAQAGLASIQRNSAVLANRIQSFDTSRYLRARREADRVGSHASDGLNAAHAERLRHFEETLASLDAIQETNEGLLVELDKLAGELVSLSAASPTDQSDYILDEIRRLVEEAKYYR